jgi:cell division protein FtsB
MDRVIYKRNRENSKSNSNGEGLKIFNNLFFQIGFIVISAILLYSIYKAVNITSVKLDILNRAEREVEELRLANLSLSIEMLDMSTDKYLEKEARNRLNYAGKNEIAFVLPQSSLEYANQQVEKILNKQASKSIATNQTGKEALDAWVEFILKGV